MDLNISFRRCSTGVLLLLQAEASQQEFTSSFLLKQKLLKLLRFSNPRVRGTSMAHIMYDVRKFIHSGYLGGWEFRDDMFFFVFGSIFWSAKRSLFPLTDTSGPQKTHIAMRTQPSSTFLTSATRARKLFERSSEPTSLSCLPKSGIKKTN